MRNRTMELTELTNEEAALIEGFRRGHIVLGGNWIRLSEKELEIIGVMRAGKFGEITLLFRDGEPRITRISFELLHGKFSERQATLELISRLQEKYQ